MIKILFVCHGNICRSPMAEFIMKDLVEKNNLRQYFEISSVATSTEEIYNGKGNPIYPPAKKILKQYHIGNTSYTDFSNKRAKQFTIHDYHYYDYILAADTNNIRNLMCMIQSDPDHKIQLLLDYSSNLQGKSIADPWYSGDFETTYEQIVLGCNGLLEAIRSKYGI